MTDLTPLEELGRQDRCLNCDAPRSEIFCQRCGQRHVKERLSVRGILRELPSRLFSLDSGFLFTMLWLWRSPGRVAREYVHGRRKRYITPLAAFLIATTAQLLALAAVSSTVKTNFVNGVREAAANDVQGNFSRLQELLGAGYEEQLADLYILTVNQGYTYATFFFFCIPLAFLLRLVHRDGDRRYRLGEHLVFSVFMVSQLLICTALANLITSRINSTVQGVVSLAIYFVYLIVAHRGFYRRGAASMLKTLISFTISVGIFAGSLIGIFGVTVIVHLVRAKAAAG